MTRPGIRQALLRPAFAHLYPGIPANEWMPAAVLTDQVLALQLHTIERVLDGAHFDFRGVPSAGASDAARRARREERHGGVDAE